jgi:hypothetical protein
MRAVVALAELQDPTLLASEREVWSAPHPTKTVGLCPSTDQAINGRDLAARVPNYCNKQAVAGAAAQLGSHHRSLVKAGQGRWRVLGSALSRAEGGRWVFVGPTTL